MNAPYPEDWYGHIQYRWAQLANCAKQITPSRLPKEYCGRGNIENLRADIEILASRCDHLMFAYGKLLQSKVPDTDLTPFTNTFSKAVREASKEIDDAANSLHRENMELAS